MDTSMVEKLAHEYARLVDEGWSPDLEEFLGRVPQELREPCRLQIQGLMSIAQEVVPPDLDEEPEDPSVVDEYAPETVEAEEVPDVLELSLDAEPTNVVDEPVDAPPAGPQRLTKEEALAMWDSQRDRS